MGLRQLPFGPMNPVIPTIWLPDHLVTARPLTVQFKEEHCVAG